MKTKLIFYAPFLLLTVFLSSCKAPTEAFEKSGHKIDLESTVQLYKNYRNDIKPTINTLQRERIDRNAELYESTEYVLVSIQQLEKYIEVLKYVENLNKKSAGDNSNEITGIAIFLGANNLNKELKDTPVFNHNITKEAEAYAKDDKVAGDIRGRITLFFAPTFRDNASGYVNEFARHRPFYIMPHTNENKYKGTYTPLYNLLEPLPPNNVNRTVNLIPDGTSLNADEFNSMPPKRN